MTNYSSELVIDILKKEYPEIESTIRQRIIESIPDKLQDLQLIPQIINTFKEIKGLDYSVWMMTDNSSKEIIENRNLLMAVLMMFYHPEKLFRMTDRMIKKRLLSSTAAQLNCTIGALKFSMSGVIVAFMAYRSFREETHELYNKIKAENKFFE